MKKLYTMLFLHFVVLSLAYGQEEKARLPIRRYFEGVITAGLNASQIDGDGYTGFNMPGALIGVGAKYVLNNEWAIGPEFLYSGKGARNTQDDQAKGASFYKYRLHYIDFPLLAYYTVPNAQQWTFEGGVVISRLFKAKLDNGDASGDVTNRWTKNDYSVIGGFEYRFSDKISAVARWTYSVWPANINYDFSDPQYSGIALRGNGIRNNTISIAVRIHLHQALN
jgi:opacity protein-like surface antigen